MVHMQQFKQLYSQLCFPNWDKYFRCLFYEALLKLFLILPLKNKAVK